MSKVQLYILVAVLTVVGLGLFLYKAFFLGFPLKPKTRSQVWNVEARVTFVAENKPVKVSLFLPSSSARFAVVDEHFVSKAAISDRKSIILNIHRGTWVHAENDQRVTLAIMEALNFAEVDLGRYDLAE